MLWSFSTQVAEPSPWHDHDIIEFLLCLGTGGRLVTTDGDVAFQPARDVLAGVVEATAGYVKPMKGGDGWATLGIGFRF